MVKTIVFNILFIFTFSAIAFAKGDGVADDLNKEKPKGYTLTNKTEKQFSSFSLRSGMYFKGENVINSEPEYSSNYFNFNNVINSNTNYVPAYKKKAILSKLTFNPNELLRNYSGK